MNAGRRSPGRTEILQGFAPIARRDAQLLILGSMPGAASLAAGEYYAHPRNAFWPLLEAVWDIPRSARYATRVRAVRAAGIAIWDVLQRCRRPTSLDADIDAASAVANDFAGFLRLHPRIHLIAFNGTGAETLFRRHVLTDLPTAMQRIPRIRLPSTSPAHASMGFEAKVDSWRTLRGLAGPMPEG